MILSDDVSSQTTKVSQKIAIKYVEKLTFNFSSNLNEIQNVKIEDASESS